MTEHSPPDPEVMSILKGCAVPIVLFGCALWLLLAVIVK